MDKRFSEMTIPEQLTAYESACLEVSQLKAEIVAWKEASGLECGGDPDGITPAKAKKFWDAEAKRIEAFQRRDIERQVEIKALCHDLAVVEQERNEAQKELAEWRRSRSTSLSTMRSDDEG